LGMISGWGWILPAVTVVGWILSWWGTQSMRWGLLAVAPFISLLCIVTGFLIAGPLSPPAPPGCPGVAACTNVVPVYWWQSGLYGLVCAVALIVVTTVVEAIVWIAHRASAKSLR